MKYFQIKPNLYLVEQEIENKSVAPTANNHLWIFDRSGSMSGDLRQLITDMKQRARSLKVGETLSLAWFSSEGEFRFITKGYKISENETFREIDATLDKHISTVGMTCFSEVLLEASKTIEDLSAFGNFSMMMFTDGQPIVSDYKAEIENIFVAIGKLSTQITSALLVAYGNYYNKSLMQEMAEKLGGSLIHSNSIASFGTSLEEYITSSREVGDKVKVDAKYTSNKDIYFSIFGKGVISYKPVKDVVSYVIGKGAKDNLYILTDKLKGNEEEIKSLEELGPRHSFIKGMYGLSAVLSQKTETLLAVDVLGALGDKYLIDLIYDSFTNSEYGIAEKNITEAMASPSSRLKKGRVVGYVKADDAICLLDVMDKITEDESAELFPYSGSGYSRVGKKTEAKTDVTTTFQPDEGGLSVGDIVWSSSKLNLSLRVVVPGTIELDDEAKKLNLTKEFRCNVFRTFTVIRDGKLNMEKATFKLSKETHDFLKSVGCTEEEYLGKPVEYDLTAVPVMNRKYANSVKSVKPFCDLAMREAELEGIVKVLKANAKAQKATAFNPATNYSDAVTAYLAKFHIKNGVYSPPSTVGAASDFYMSKKFSIKIKGLSSLPKIDDVTKKIEAKKALTTADTVIKLGLDELAQTKDVEKAFKDRQQELREVRAALLRQKFAIVLGKAWFEEFAGERKDSYEFEHKKLNFTFELGEEKVAL